METVTINANEVLEECYRLIFEARSKVNYNYHRPEFPLHIVLPFLQDRAIRYYLAGKPSEQIFVTGTFDPYSKYLFGAIKLTSEIIDKPIVF